MNESEARRELEPFVLDGVEIEEVTGRCEDAPDRDLFGNSGTTRREEIEARGFSAGELSAASNQYLGSGYTELPRDSYREDDQVRYRRRLTDPSNPFLLECEVEVGIGGRDLIGSQRALLAGKASALETELADPGCAPERRPVAASMLAELERALLPRVSILLTRRTFRPEPLLSAGATLGDGISLGWGHQLVYSVVPLDPADREDEPGEPMYITILGVGESSVAFQYSGGLHGQRIVTDLENGPAHHAWFRNRQNDETADTAPFLARRIVRELADRGESSVIIRRERDPEPIVVRRTELGTRSLEVEGTPRELPVLVAETEKDDRLVVLADPSCPLVLRLAEAEAELLRTVTEIRRLP